MITLRRRWAMVRYFFWPPLSDYKKTVHSRVYPLPAWRTRGGTKDSQEKKNLAIWKERRKFWETVAINQFLTLIAVVISVLALVVK